jgi:hypothetical protein
MEGRSGAVSKLSRWPRVFQDQLVEPETDTDFLLDDFDETIAADIESTRRGMRALSPGSMPSAEFMAMQNKLVDGLIEEVKELRHELAKVVQSLNRKASKKTFEDFSKSMREGTDKRLDTIRNWALALIAAGGFAMALLRK